MKTMSHIVCRKADTLPDAESCLHILIGGLKCNVCIQEDLVVRRLSASRIGTRRLASGSSALRVPSVQAPTAQPCQDGIERSVRGTLPESPLGLLFAAPPIWRKDR